jgi:hypothetical protein
MEPGQDLTSQSEEATLPELFREGLKMLQGAAPYLYLTRSSTLQKAKRDELTTFKERIRGFKRGAAAAEDEQAANGLFHMQCVLNAQVACLNLLIQVKGRDYHKAWCYLIDSQEYLSVAERASDEGFKLEWFRTHIENIETAIFPRIKVYNSWGAIIKGGKCTICFSPFRTCEHVEGKVYMGKLCVRVSPEIVSMDHMAIVDDPRDRRCILTEISDDDGYFHDHFTLKRKDRVEKKEGAGLMTRGIIFSNRLLEYD